MKHIYEKETIWAEKYRPKYLEDVIFPEELKSKLKEELDNGNISNIGFFGQTGGNGKTSISDVIKNTLNTETLYINASKENGVDTFRYKVSEFASKKSQKGKIRLVLLAEADNLSLPAQKLLREDIERYSNNARFIMTGNYPDKIIEPLLQRFQVYNMDDIFQKYKKEIAKQMFERLTFILNNEGVKFDKQQLLDIIRSYFPSTRAMIMFIQQNTINKELKFDSISQITDTYDEILDLTLKQDWGNVKKIVDGILTPDSFYTYMWRNINKIPVDSRPDIIINLADYQDMNTRAKNKQITLMAFLTKVMQNI